MRMLVALLGGLAAFAVTEAQAQAVPSPPRPASAPAWGLYARAGGQAFNWRSRDLGWRPDPNAHPGEIEAGYGVRRGAVSLLLGYEQPDDGAGAPFPVMDRTRSPQPPIPLIGGGPAGVFGFGLTVRLR
ncbi:MAG: hypothetical protein JO127_15025 [Caulobacteraceae bacterium]|nr:hypothetical protein [Caulobacteraceae bacterium]